MRPLPMQNLAVHPTLNLNFKFLPPTPLVSPALLPPCRAIAIVVVACRTVTIVVNFVTRCAITMIIDFVARHRIIIDFVALRCPLPSSSSTHSITPLPLSSSSSPVAPLTHRPSRHCHHRHLCRLSRHCHHCQLLCPSRLCHRHHHLCAIIIDIVVVTSRTAAINTLSPVDVRHHRVAP